MVFGERFTAKVFLRFLRRLLRRRASKVFLIVDRHPVHVSKAAVRWVAEHQDRIALFFMPGYSPELNPDEYLNNDVKANAVGRRRAKDVEELQSHVRAYFNHPDVQYAAG